MISLAALATTVVLSSTALVIVDRDETARVAERAAALAGLTLDVFDVRREGQLTTDVMLRYLGRSIVIPRVSGVFDATAVRQYLANGGSVFMSREEDAGENTELDKLFVSFRKAVRELTPDGSIATLSIYAGNQFSASAPKGLVITDSLTGDDEEAEAARLAQDLTLFELVRGSFQDKVAAYLAGAAPAKAAVLFELTKEMADNKAVRGDNYRNKRAALKLSTFVELTLARQGTERRALLLVYPDLERARTLYEKSGWWRGSPIREVLRPLKTAYEREVEGRPGN